MISAEVGPRVFRTVVVDGWRIGCYGLGFDVQWPLVSRIFVVPGVESAQSVLVRMRMVMVTISGRRATALKVIGRRVHHVTVVQRIRR